MPGICTSVIRQALSSTRGERRKSSADLNAQAMKPSDLARLSIAARTDSSSSTIETIGDFDTRGSLALRDNALQRSAGSAQRRAPSCANQQNNEIIQTFVRRILAFDAVRGLQPPSRDRQKIARPSSS